MASALSAGASAAIKYSIAILGRAPTEAELNSFAAAYKGASATASEDAVAAAVVASTAGASALRPGVFSATKQAQVILGNHGVTNDAVVAYVASMIDGTNADAGKVALPLGTVARVVANFFSSWTSTPSNPYNDVFMAGSTALKKASTDAENAILNPVAPTPVTPSYTLSADASVDEGKSTIVTLTTKNVADGSTVNYIISGVDSSDVGALIGTATVGADGKAYIKVDATADAKTEGEETMVITAGGATASIKINDKSVDAPKSLALTTGVDTTLVGGSTDDTYTASALTAATNTLTAGDQLDGGAGSDTLAFTVNVAGTYGQGVSSKAVESVRVTNTSGGIVTMDGTLFSDVTKVENSGSTNASAVVFDRLKAIPAVSMTGTNSATTVQYADANVTGGVADSASVTVLNSALAGPVTLTMEGIETLNASISSSGTADSVVAGVASAGNSVTLVDAALRTLNLTGTGGRVIAPLGTASSTVTGTVTSNEGAHDVAITGAAATGKVSVAMGAGNDTVRVSSSIGTTTATYTIDGGDGTDTLIMGVGADSVTGANISNFESVTVTGAVSVALPTAKNVVGTATFEATGGTVDGLAAGGTVNIPYGGSATVSNAAWATPTTDTLTVNVGNSSRAAADTSVVTATGIDAATINILGSAADTANARTVGVTAAAMKTLTVNATVAHPVTISQSATNTGLTTVNAAGVAGAVTFTQTATSTVGVNVTGGAGADVLTGALGADTLIGGAGNDSLVGNAGADVLDGGDGNNTLAGGTGADTMTGGSGRDVFQITANDLTSATPALHSTLNAPDVIRGFTTGTDKIVITGQAPTAYLGEFANIQAALATASTTASAPVLANAAFFVTGESNLYVINNVGVAGTSAATLSPSDLVIKLEGVTKLAQGDFLIGSQGQGNSITLAAGTGSVGVNTVPSPSTFATETTANTNSPAGAAFTTSDNDTVSVQANLAVGTATVDAGAGSDTLALTLPATATSTSGTVGVGALANFTNFETITLAARANSATTGTTYWNVSIPAATVSSNGTLAITLNHAGSDSTGALPTAGNGNVIDASPVSVANSSSTANKKVSITGGSGHDQITGGAFNDTIAGGSGNDSISGGLGTNRLDGGDGDDTIISGSATDVIIGGGGNDAVTLVNGTYGSTASITDASGTTDTLTLTGVAVLANAISISAATVSGFEVLNLSAPNTAATYFALSAAQLAAFTGGVSVTTITTPANANIQVDATTAARAAGTVTLDADIQNYTVLSPTSGTAPGVTFSAPAAATAYSVTGGDGNDVIGFGSATGGNQTIAGGVGDDAITFLGAAFDANDAINGGAGNDSLTLAGATSAVSAASLRSGFTGIESIVTAQTSVSVTLSFADDANVSDTAGISINGSSLTTGALTFTALSTEAGGHTVTGGGGDDSITGGAGADSLIAAGGSDTVRGGAGNDAINAGTGNNLLQGGQGNDTITLTDGGASNSDVVLISTGDARNGTTAWVDTIVGFATGAGKDVIQIGIGDLDAGAGTLTASASTGGDITAATAAVVQSAASNQTFTIATTANVIKFTSVASTSFASAIGSGVITLNFASTGDMAVGAVGTGTTEGIIAMYYDATNARAVVGIISNAAGQSGTDLDQLTSADTFTSLMLVGMTSDEYTAMTTANLGFGG